MKKLLLFLGLFCLNLTYGQATFEHAVDSLEEALETELPDKIRVDYLNQLASILMRADTSKSYRYAEEALELSRETEYGQGEILSLNWFARFYTEQGQLDTALIILDNLISKKHQAEDLHAIAQAYISKGNLYDINGSYSDALAAYFEAEKIFIDLGDSRGVGMANMGIGNIYQLTERYQEAIKHFRYSANELIKIESPYASWSLNNMAEAMEAIEMFDSAAIYYNKSLVMKEEAGDFYGASFTYTNLGNLAERKDELEKAEFYYRKALDVKALAEGMSRESVGKSYLNLGEVLLKQGKISEATSAVQIGLKNALESGAVLVTSSAYLLLSKCLSLGGNYQAAYQSLRDYTDLNDSIIKMSNANKLAEMQTLYETAEKDAELAAVNSENELNILRAENAETESSRANTLLVAAIVVLVFLLLAIILAVRVIRERKKNNQILKAKNEEITIQKEIVEEKSNEILDSINYAKRIQSAILPPIAHIKSHHKEVFVLYKPKDIVAGDFYWMEHQDNKLFLAAADCTGHGVPGAMVSVVCNNGLNRALREYGLRSPGDILNKTREIVIQEFEKSEEEVKDGMDIALISLDFSADKEASAACHLNYAGAHNPLWIVRAGTTDIEEIKADKQPIGKFSQTKPFTTHSVELQKGDSVYVFSDGFADQFGGEKGKKFKSSNFKKLLVSIKDKPLEEQRKLLDDSFESWKGTLEQLDDVCVIGLKI